ncbi:hypothetical protein PWT90_00410 [Aphanocladium album]|nr:hypothetical protein PWT90_00410 [Aphanocladium album]
MQLNEDVVGTLVNLTTAAAIHPDHDGQVIFPILSAIVTLAAVAMANPIAIAFSAVVDVIMVIFEHLYAKDLAAQNRIIVENLINQKVQEYHLDRLHKKIKAIRRNLNQFKSVWSQFDNAPSGEKKIFGDNLRDHYGGLLSTVDSNMAEFQAYSFAVQALPDFALVANIHILVLALGMKYGESWGYPEVYIKGNLPAEFNRVTGSRGTAPAAHKRSATYNFDAGRQYEDKNISMQYLAEAINHGQALGWPADLIETWKDAYSAHSVPRRGLLASGDVDDGDYPNYTNDTWMRGRSMVQFYKPPPGEHHLYNDGNDEAGALRALADYDALMITNVLSFAELWPYLIGEFEVPEQVLINLDREIYSGPYGGYGPYWSPTLRRPSLGTQPGRATGYPHHFPDSVKDKHPPDSDAFILVNHTPWSATRGPPAQPRNGNITALVLYADEAIQGGQTRYGDTWDDCFGSKTVGQSSTIELGPDEFIERVDTGRKRAAASDKGSSTTVWATLITNLDYLAGLLTLNHSLQKVQSAYPLLALYTDSFPANGLAALAARGIPAQRVEHLLPSAGSRDFSADPRFAETFTKLATFSLAEYDRIVQLDSDMLVLRNMDELMEIPLDDPALSETGTADTSERVFAASHVCACNPLKKSHYPKTWVRENCAFTSQAADPARAQREGLDPRGREVAMMNGGLAVLRPSKVLYEQIVNKIERDGRDMYFPDQEVVSELWRDRWVALPYVYNALKTMRRRGVHDAIWRDDEVKNIHYILSPKPWDEVDEQGNFTGEDETHGWWVAANQKRKAEEKKQGISDGY